MQIFKKKNSLKIQKLCLVKELLMYRMSSLTSEEHVPISEAVVEVKNTNTSETLNKERT